MNRKTRNLVLIAGVVAVIAVVSVRSFRATHRHSQSDISEELNINTLFGLPVDSFHISEKCILPNQNLGSILTGSGISMSKVDQLVRNSEGVFDVRKIRSGNPYYLFQASDSTGDVQYLVYEENRIEYVVFSLSDSLSVRKGRKPVHNEQRSARGVITSNLWNTMKDNNLNPALAIEMSEIYAWTIDFFGIRAGDRFRILFEEQFVDTTSIGVGPVYAAEFEHMGKTYYAFRYFQDEGCDYFDDRGENLRKAFLKSPLKFSRISSHFSGSRLHPILKIRRPHFGVDYAAPKGTPVMTIGDGTVLERSYQGGAGNIVKIKHNAVYTTHYMHLAGFARGIAPGVRVRQGEVIGYVGTTGLSTGPHLDFRVYKNGTPIDPLKLDAPPGEPVKPELKEDYLARKDSLTALLYKINWNE